MTCWSLPSLPLLSLHERVLEDREPTSLCSKLPCCWCGSCLHWECPALMRLFFRGLDRASAVKCCNRLILRETRCYGA